MNIVTNIIAAGALTFGSAAIAQVREPAPAYKVSPPVQVMERNARGMATVVAIGGQRYAVCMNDMQDNCIQPRAAGFKFGGRPLPYWPNKPTDTRS